MNIWEKRLVRSCRTAGIVIHSARKQFYYNKWSKNLEILLNLSLGFLFLNLIQSTPPPPYFLIFHLLIKKFARDSLPSSIFNTCLSQETLLAFTKASQSHTPKQVFQYFLGSFLHQLLLSQLYNFCGVFKRNLFSRRRFVIFFLLTSTKIKSLTRYL